MRRTRQAAAAVALGVLLPAPPLPAAVVHVGPEQALAAAVAAAHTGDELVLAPGHYRGGLRIERTLTLRGEAGAVVDGSGRGRVITVAAPGVQLTGLIVTGSGTSLQHEDAGVFVEPAGRGACIEGNRIEGNLIGVYLKGSPAVTVRDNDIVGRTDLHMSERGNGVHVWNAPGALVADNRIEGGRDGIFVSTSRDDVFRGNRFRRLRYGVHYMYTNDSAVIDNDSSGNHAGFAVMFSTRIEVAGNRSHHDRDHGVLLNFVNDSVIHHNVVEGPTHKCVFVYNANFNRLHHNVFRGCDIGIHFTAGSEGMVVHDNAFIGNRTQVKYVGTRWLEWSWRGRGNYWSDNLAFDLDGDGIADQPYRPNDLVDELVFRQPAARLFLGSPAAQLLRWAQRELPGLHPGGVVDSHPLMAPPGTSLQARP